MAKKGKNYAMIDAWPKGGQDWRFKMTTTTATPEATKSLKVQVATTLLEAGFAMAKISKMNNTAGRRWENYHGGFTFLVIKEIIWHDGSITPSKVRVRRWAQSENPFINSRQLSSNDYKVCLEAAGFIIEVKGKDLFVVGKERVAA